MKIGLLAYPGCVISGLFAFYELLQMANKRSGKRLFELTWCGLTLGPMKLGLEGRDGQIEIETLLDDPELDGVLVPGFWSDTERGFVLDMATHRELIDVLAKNFEGRSVWGYCTGVGLLAEAGLLKAGEATSTWWLAEHFTRTYPDIRWNFSQTCVASEGVITASGVSGYLSIARSLISLHLGDRVWHDLSDVMVLPQPKPSFQPFQEIKMMKLESVLLRRLCLWVERTPARLLSLSCAAHELNLSERSLSRKVRADSGLACVELIRRIKLSQAAELLDYTRDQVAVISDRLGYSDQAVFRRSFKHHTGMTPGEYRRTRG